MPEVKWEDENFQQTITEMEKTVKHNTQSYGAALAKAYEQSANQSAPWADKHGVARRGLKGTSYPEGKGVMIEMGGRAPNYKRGPRSASDYMEFLEFAHGGRFAVIYPTVDAIAEHVRSSFGDAALMGKADVNIIRMKHRKR